MIFNIIKNNLDIVSYRKYFDKIGLKGICSWSSMTKEDIENDNLKIKETQRKIIF